MCTSPGTRDGLTTGAKCDIIVRRDGLVSFSYPDDETRRQRVFCRIGPSDTVWFKAGDCEVEMGKAVILEDTLVLVLAAVIE